MIMHLVLPVCNIDIIPLVELTTVITQIKEKPPKKLAVAID